MRLTKQDWKRHDLAMKRLEKAELTYEDKWFILENIHEGALIEQGYSGAFFTPPHLASDFNLHVSGNSIIDLCAGIGTLAFMAYHHTQNPPQKLVCVERNHTLLEIGKKILPEAEWICADVLEVWPELGHYDMAIANPPFGRIQNINKAPKYQGQHFEFKIIDVAAHIADYGAFIIPPTSSPFQISGVPCFRAVESAKHDAFYRQTGFHLQENIGLDTAQYKDEWKGTNIITEVVTCDFIDQRQDPAYYANAFGKAEQLALI